MQRLSVLTVGIILVLFTTLRLVDAATSEPAAAQPVATPSDCIATANKSVDPSTVPLGEDVGVTLVFSGTCGAQPLPVDIVIVADESKSMTEARGGGGGGAAPTVLPMPSPGTPVLPTPRPPGGFPTQAGGEPSFCPGGAVPRPSATPTRFSFFTPTPERPPPTVDPEPGGSEDLIRESQQWVRDFLDEPVIKRDFANGRLRMGFVSFNSRPVLRQALSEDASNINSTAGRMRGDGITRINSAITEADRIMNGAGSRPEDGRTKIVIVLSDFQVCQRDIAGGGGGRNPSNIVTVGMGRDYNSRKAGDLATQREYVLEPRDLKKLIELYERELTKVTGLTVQQVVVNDELAANMEYVADSAQPPPSSIAGKTLQWLVDAPVFPASFSYRVRPLDPGVHPVSAAAAADWTDTVGHVGHVAFPNVDVEVIPPTSTPTATAEATATATATALPPDLYLPIAIRLWPEAIPTPCVPAEQVLDVAFIMDTSTSMSDPTQQGGQAKIEAAIDAVVEFVGLLKPTDQAAVIGFNAAPTVAAGLTSDQAALTAALRSLRATQAAGTSIDLGLLAGLEEMRKTSRPSDARAMVLVTDGRHTGDTGAEGVRAAATAVKAAGIRLVTVGLGSSEEIDEALLREIASTPDLYFPAPDAADLQRIYREIVHLIPCQ